jgi:hypothetical protein
MLEQCATTTVVTFPGTSWMLPCGEPARIAELVSNAVQHI